MASYRLITLGLCPYCEKARWALDRARVPFVEEPHLPPFQALATRRRGGGGTVPVLVTDSDVYADSSEIVDVADRHASGALYGSGETRRQARELAEHFDAELGGHAKRIAFFHALGETELAVKGFGRGVGAVEKTAFRTVLPAVRALARRRLGLTALEAERSRAAVERVFDQVEARFSDGRRFFVGDRFTVADLAFASLAAPLIAPPEHGWPLPPLGVLPKALRDEITRFRERPAGRLVLRLYREERQPSAGPA